MKKFFIHPTVASLMERYLLDYSFQVTEFHSLQYQLIDNGVQQVA